MIVCRKLLRWWFLVGAMCVALMTSSVAAKTRLFKENQGLSGQMVAQQYDDLCVVADGSLAYLNRGKKYDKQANRVGVIADFGYSLARVKQTLAFICQVYQADKKANRVSRLQDVDFIAQHFDMLRWLPNKQQAAKFADNKPLLQNIPDEQILLTKYYIKLAQGSVVKTPKTPHALYALPHDEQHLTLEQAEKRKAQLIRYRYTKHEVLSGILDKNDWAEPLLWLSRDDLEDTLMQGTVKVDTDLGSRYFNVHRNNGIGYHRGLKKREQKRYWYFKETPGPLGYGKDADFKVPIHALVTVAGDIGYFGLGKLFMLSHNNQHRLAILADTGGAFAHNHYQLDYLGGYFKNWQDYVNTYRHFPDYFEARILVLKASL